MLNQVVLVGRLTDDPEVSKTSNEKQVSKITLAVNRGFKNADGIYETDFIKCTLWNGIAQNTFEYCKKGDLVGLKGRLQNDFYEDDKGVKHYLNDIIAEKITFLSSKKVDE